VLIAISAGASYFGAMTYIGNAPNLMVKSIAESYGVRMPHFFAYMAWSTLCLLPLLLLTMLVFFR
jgi:Na+/H+ antiporter NhaD/arsenite permease-like protein